jgi:hypothetical protein
MAFRQLTSSSFRGRINASEPTVAVYVKNGQPQTTVLVPREMLRQAGLSDLPGSQIDILVGEGADAGCIAIIEGPRYTLRGNNPNNPKSLVTRSGLLGKAEFKSRAVKAQVGRKQIVLTLPADFPWTAPVVANGHAPRAIDTSEQAVAA